MSTKTRNELINQLFPDLPRFREDQINTALFDPSNKNWDKLTTLSKEMRDQIIKSVPWTSLHCAKIIESGDKETRKALLQTQDMHAIESVLMKNKREQWTICISSQIGCAMGCAFCATGKMGLTRNLDIDEIVDQIRFWQSQIKTDERISNIVVMGMGEPLINYENVRDALNLILKYTSVGKTRITVSTAGVLPRMQQILTDPLWPHVRFAVSLHSVDVKVRKQIMPSSTPTFLDDLAIWAKQYLSLHGNRRHHLTFEYLLLSGINDSDADAKKLANYVNKIGDIKVNVLIYNQTDVFSAPTKERIQAFSKVLQNCGVNATRRRSMGQDIFAACGQLAQTA
ncbi:23S rRNA (adenine(2503)-C(2))-methyltransferase RlmN [Candidatus Parcubacteria bacterium]|nr:23S rRNA (adenine(2503)-C(2))-methyltransferase RlmN [Patescibacteria group bacterium]MCG2687494.1 23S rRNA (adenine(2503)-C(2))-methyltransferase RlmN [Candidatus Parcubacteria bacterium]